MSKHLKYIGQLDGLRLVLVSITVFYKELLKNHL